MIIRLAEERDLYELMAFVDNRQSDRLEAQGYTLNRKRLQENLLLMIQTKTVVVGTMPLGEGDETAIIAVIAGQFMPCLFSNDIFFVAMFLYVVPHYRSRTCQFLKKFEELLRLTNATKFIISNPRLDGHDKIERFYQQRGFHKLETHMVKNIEKEVAHVG